MCTNREHWIGRMKEGFRSAYGSEAAALDANREAGRTVAMPASGRFTHIIPKDPNLRGGK